MKMSSRPIDIIKLSEWIIAFFTSKGDYISNKKLQKLLYYIQAWHLVYFKKDIFNEAPQAWVHGPVFTSVYHHYKKFGYEPLKISDDKMELYLKTPLHEILSITIQQENLINVVIKKYGSLQAYELEMLSHSETPWKEKRKGLSQFDRSESPISLKTMKDYYSSLV